MLFVCFKVPGGQAMAALGRFLVVRRMLRSGCNRGIKSLNWAPCTDCMGLEICVLGSIVSARSHQPSSVQ